MEGKGGEGGGGREPVRRDPERRGGQEDGDRNSKPTSPACFHPGCWYPCLELSPPRLPHWVLLFGYKHLKCLVLDSPLMIIYFGSLSSSPAEAVGCEGSSSALLASRAHVCFRNNLQNASCPSMHPLRGLRGRRALSTQWLCLGAAARVMPD